MNINNKDLNNLHKKGIYKIENLKTNRFYIGSVSGKSSSFLKRFKTHFNELKKNTHFNLYLQNSFNKYGESAFQFSIIEILEKNILLKEQFYLDLFTKDIWWNYAIDKEFEFYKNGCLVVKTTMEKFGELLEHLEIDNQQLSQT